MNEVTEWPLAQPLFAQRLKHLQHLGVSILGQQVYLEIELISLIRLKAAAVLAHQNEERQEDRLWRHDHRQESERKRIQT
jgi:hypothetical protein